MKEGNHIKSSEQQWMEKAIGGGITLHEEAVGLEPFPWYQHMRAVNPLYYDQENEMWHVFGYQDVLNILNNPSVYSSEARHHLRTPEERAANPGVQILSMDPPRHRQIRSFIEKAFTPRTVARLASRIEDIVNQHLDHVAVDGKMNLIADLAQPLPTMVIAELLGIPHEDRKLFRLWSDKTISPDRQVAGQAHQDIAQYLRQIIDQKRKEPKDDLITALLHVQVNGQRLSEDEIASIGDLLLIAGNETTTNLLGNAFLCFDENPGVIEQLRENPELTPNAIEEVLRYRSPIQRLIRLVTEDTLLHGKQLHKGDLVNVWTGSANRDEEVFPDANLFDLRRSPNRHIGFGHGIHFCIGAPLSRLEAKIALNILLQRFQTLQRDRTIPLKRIETLTIFYGVQELPITFIQDKQVGL